MDRNIITQADIDAANASNPSEPPARHNPFTSNASNPSNPSNHSNPSHDDIQEALAQLPPRAVNIIGVAMNSTLVLDGVPEAVTLDANGLVFVVYSRGPRHRLLWMTYAGTVPGAAYCVGLVPNPYGGVQALYADPC